MQSNPEIALLISSYQRPAHLRRALLSIALQQGVTCPIEVVVTDDGSTDETPEVVRRFAQSVNFPVQFTTHPHAAFQLARCRNEGVAASTAPYILFLDGDCILPPDHIAIHLARRRPGIVMAGDCARLDEPTSARVSEAAIHSGEFTHWASPEEIKRLKRLMRRATRHRFRWRPRKPDLTGNNVGVWRTDYERVNGYDENFVGWGAEDDDLGRRLRRAGVRVRSILHWTYTYHLWHPTEKSKPDVPHLGPNARYMRSEGKLIRCRNGMTKRPLEQLQLKVVGGPPPTMFRKSLPASTASADDIALEVEIAFSPGATKFSGLAQCNVLVVLEDTPATKRLVRDAHILVANRELPTASPKQSFRLHQFDQALKAVA
jgi:glycosyltransferase involved in cell wall biosynthesis